MPNSGLKFFVDMKALAETLGAFEGAEEVASTDSYINGLIHAAHDIVEDEFDMAAVATATATGALAHMFEWGTAGVNRGRTTRRMNPMNPESHLWKHTLEGTGKSATIGYTFKASKVPVPLPTVTKTGIQSQYINRLKGKHIFWNKAAVMELGTPVDIVPKPGKKLFIPTMGKSFPERRPSDINKGFIMYEKPVRVIPGAQTAGTFDAFWERFWNGAGADSMQKHIEETFVSDFDVAINESGRSNSSMSPASAELFNSQVRAGRTKGTSKMKSRTARRTK